MASIMFLVAFVTYCSISTIGSTINPINLPRDLEGQISTDAWDINRASVDYGGLAKSKPLAVLYPASSNDIVSLIRAAYNSTQGFTVSAKGQAHSTHGQAQTANGVVVEMSRGSKTKRLPLPRISTDSSYVDVWGGETWIDVLNWTLRYGVGPRSWTDYLHLSVGGTLSNAGISGQTYNFGPQISNVYELDIVTGKGELLTCSKTQNSELFHGVLGGLGQFGIITRARIALDQAPQRVKWIQVMYKSFSSLTKDQEYLISLQGKPNSERFDYVEGYVAANGGIQYWLEITKNYGDSTVNTIDQEVEALLKRLDFIPSSMIKQDVTYLDFLERVHKDELKLRSEGLWDVPHPWLNLFVPKSRMADFDHGVFKGILGNQNISWPMIIYPVNKNKWDYESSAVTPDEDVFYVVSLLVSALDSGEETQRLQYLLSQNNQIIRFCAEAGIKMKQYLPNYSSQKEWRGHFGDGWKLFQRRKMEFDPKFILATGQRIF